MAVPGCPTIPGQILGFLLTSLVELSTKGPPNIAAIQSQLEMSRGLWALIAPSSSTKVTSGDKQRDATGTRPHYWGLSHPLPQNVSHRGQRREGIEPGIS